MSQQRSVLKSLITAFGIGLFMLTLGFAHAADFANDDEAQLVPCGSYQRGSNEDCNWDHLIELANNIVNFLVFASSMLAVMAFCYAGFLYITAAGNSGKVEQAHGIFKMVMIGMLFVLGGWLIIATILKVLVGGADGANVSRFIDFNPVKTLNTSK